MSFSLLKHYKGVSFSTRLFILFRLASCPFRALVSYVPRAGSLLDLGCGFGALPLMLVVDNPTREIVGIDPDRERIDVATKAAKPYKNLLFITGTIDTLVVKRRFDLVTVVDVLYLLPDDQKVTTIQGVRRLLKKGGKLIIKINDKNRSLAYFLTWLQEYLMVRLFKKTASLHRGLYFENPQGIKRLLNRCDMGVETIVRLPTPFPFFHPHWLVIAVK